MNIRLYKNEIDENFSLKEWLVEQKLLPYQILLRRIQQIINYCKFKRIYDINLDDTVKSFITDYLQMIFRQTIRNPSNFNYIIGLRIARYLSQSQFYNFNIVLKQVTKMIKRGDKITYDWMQKLLREYDNFELNMINYINLRINK